MHGLSLLNSSEWDGGCRAKYYMEKEIIKKLEEIDRLVEFDFREQAHALIIKLIKEIYDQRTISSGDKKIN